MVLERAVQPALLRQHSDASLLSSGTLGVPEQGRTG